MKQLTLSFFKPDTFGERGIKNKVREAFFEELKKNNLEIVVLGEKFKFTPELVEAHYGHTKKYGFNASGENIFEKLKKFLIPENANETAECQAMIIWGEDAIKKVRNIIGPTKSATWGLRSTSKSAEVDSPENYIHASDIAKEGDPYREVKEEMQRFFGNIYPSLVKDKKYSEFFNN